LITISRLSTEYVQVQVTFTVSGAQVNPTGDTVQMAFTHGGALPGVSDWHTASWETAGTVHYAQCLVGPSGGVVLAPGTWNVWLKVTDSPEVPVRSPAQLQIT
jgi:hypothetical protein